MTRRRSLRGTIGRPSRGGTARRPFLRGTIGRQSRGGTTRRPLLRGTTRRPSLRGQAAQATVELVALLPLLLTAALAGFAVLAARAADEQAGQAAEAGALALLQDREPMAAARAALPDGARARAEVRVDDRRVTVRIRPDLPLPALATRLTAKATADAGPDPTAAP
jgi:hypothetical protein